MELEPETDASKLLSGCYRQIMAARRAAKRHGDMSGFTSVYRALTAAMLNRFLEFDREDQLAVIGSVTSSESGFLQGIAQSAATGAVRDSDPTRLRLGVLALVIENLSDRENLMILALLDNSARKLGVDLECIFEEFGEVAKEECALRFSSYFSRANRSLGTMGFRESVDEHGRFSYVRI